jgi:hypothetical protein
MPLTKIRFPVLRSLSVEEYQLFPGKARKGLTHKFLPGVTIIAGINGLGKTTLLNMMLRSLTGAQEPRKFDPTRPVPKSREMSAGDEDYFAQRVSDRAAHAFVEAVFSFGKDVARIKRRLHDLRIEGLWVNERAIHKAKEDLDVQQKKLQSRLVELSGAADDYDFFFLIYAFTFSLEEKTSLIWHHEGQYQIFRILFLSRDLAMKLSQLEVEALKLDSEFRNRRHRLNARKDEILRTAPSQGDLPGLRADAERLQVELDRVVEQLQNWPLRIEQVLGKERKQAELLEKLYLDVEEERRRFEGLVESYFARAFPNLPDAVKVVLGQLSSQHGCLVCGNPQPKYPKQFEKMAQKGLCPFCGTDTQTHKHVTSVPEIKAKEVRESEERLAALWKSQRELESELRQKTEEKDRLYVERVQLSEERNRRHSALESVRARLPLTETELTKAMSEIGQEEDRLKQLREEMMAVKRSYEVLLKDANKTVAIAQQQLTERFNYYASEFLAEQCTLSWSPTKDTLGEEGPLIEFPRFTVQMTTALSRATGIPRNREKDVSESQKEFIDLAFRMALFDTVTGGGQPAMLVIETPEASLDLIFVGQAGHLLRKFAVGDPKRPNVVIATTNLNRENMLRSLLGLDGTPDAKTKREAPKRVINLLEEAEPNAALRKYGPQYRKEFQKALRMD